MLCEQCGEREAKVHLTYLSEDAAVEVRHLCRLCGRDTLTDAEEEIAHSAHANLPDGAVLDDVLERVERHGTPDQRRQIALMLRARAERQPARLTPLAIAYLARFDALPDDRRSPLAYEE